MNKYIKKLEYIFFFRCGTKPYIAPEVLLRPYKATPADLWSCGIVFVAMLTGGMQSYNFYVDIEHQYSFYLRFTELPWAEPTEKNEEYIKWKKEVYFSETPWAKLGNTALSLARQILNIDSIKRGTLEQIEKHPWMKFNFQYGKFLTH